MALQVTYTVKQDCKSEAMVFEDDTPDYDNAGSVLYIEGYNSPHKTRAQILASSIEIIDTNGTAYKRMVYTTQDASTAKYYADYLPNDTIRTEALTPEQFYTYKKRAIANTITSKEGATIQVYTKKGSIGNMTITLKPGALTSVTLSSTTASAIDVNIIDGTSTVAQIKTALLTHDTIPAVTTSGTTYTLGENKIIGIGGIDADTPSALASFTSGCYKLKYKVYGTAAALGAGAIVEGTEYSMYNISAPTDLITYNGFNYYKGETFIGVNGQNDYTTNASAIAVAKSSEKENTILYWCPIRDKIVNLMMLSGSAECSKDCDFVEALSKIDTELTSIFVAIENDNLDCGCADIKTVELYINEFLTKCCC